MIKLFNSIVKKHGIPKYLKRWRPADENFSMDRSIKTYHPHSKLSHEVLKELYTKPVMRVDASGIAYISIACDDDKISKDIEEFLDKTKFKGLIIDFRNHLGGSFWPVVDAFRRYLDRSSLIKFGYYWINLSSKIVFDKKFQKDENCHVPIAVIVGPKTNSSGEIAAAIFQGRPNCKLFGVSSTRGNLSCNQPFQLHNLTLWLTTTLVTTYDQKLQKTEKLTPSVLTSSPITDAKKWITE